ncbi:MAG: pseudouridylate synthase [Tannerella sp.]|jgi:predicted hotdog family 3-hydroxylacyl-ACP dehydratase|nr:pseudouridylate synthase [Tannerella sp.]
MKDISITELLPQRPPFILVDRLTHYSRGGGKTVYMVREGSPFCTNGRMEETGLIENIAQTCAARMGYEEKTEAHRDGNIKIGFVGMIKHMEIFRNPLVGEQLETTVIIREDVFSTSLVETKVEIGGELIAACDMKIFLTDMHSQDYENK